MTCAQPDVDGATSLPKTGCRTFWDLLGYAVVLPKKRPCRKVVDHEAPFWVPHGAFFFLTINCQKRGVNQLANRSIYEQLVSAWRFYNDREECCVEVLLAMPDHVHCIASFEGEVSMASVVKNWKHFTSRKCGIHWQRGFFDHRIRSEESAVEKGQYIMDNPKDAGLIKEGEVWPFYWFNKRSQM
jgi:REP element-mobilizing transposase RayT